MARLKAEEVEEKVRELVQPILDEKGLELYDVEWLSGRESRLRVVIQGIGGITLDDCQEVSKELSYLLDVEDFIHTGYLLEVSSPGLTRSLKKPEHYMKSRGEEVRVTLRTEKGDKKSVLEGRIEDADENGFLLATNEGTKRISYGKVAKAKLQMKD